MTNFPAEQDAIKPSGFWRNWSFQALNMARVHQLLVILTAGAVLCAMILIIAAMLVNGQYEFGIMLAVDAFTILALIFTIILAVREKRPQLQSVIVCLSIPANLLIEIMLEGGGAWTALLLLSLSPVVWGVLARYWMTSLYCVCLIVFFNIYLAGSPEPAVMFDGRDQTVLTAIALSTIVVASAVSALIPRKVMSTAYASIQRIARQESTLRKRFLHYANMSSDWHMEIDHNGIITDFFGSGNAVGMNWRDILFDWEGQEHVFQEALQGRGEYQKIQATLRIGSLSRRVECSGQPIFDEGGAFAGYRAIALDVTERLEAEKTLQRLATTDRLTGLKNRHAYNMAIEAGQGLSGGDRMAVMCIDLDSFKEMNDRQGHAAGDKVLAELGRRFRSMAEDIPSLDFFRLGGDEFCALFRSGWEPERLARLADRIQNVVTEPVELEERLVDISASIGLAWTGKGVSLATTTERADAAVYDAKSSGGGRTVICEGDKQDQLDRRIAIRRDLAGAISDGEISFLYQPIYEVSSRALCGVEALARWTHPVFGSISPNEFISIAEGSRDIIALGEYTLRRTCIETLEWMSVTGRSLRLNVNISPMEMVAGEFVEALSRILDETGFPPNLLELEITERGILQNIEVSKATIDEIRRKGVTVALDDFGTGHSSLSRLESLPVDRIKMDRSFFMRAMKSERAHQMIILTARMSRILGVDVVAEGIETEEQLRLVEQAGFAKVQGYLLGRPAKLETVRNEGICKGQPGPSKPVHTVQKFG